MYFTTTSFFLTLLILRFSSAKPPLHTWKIKHGSNVGITLGTVITYNILQHYSISITTLIVYFTQYSILLFLRYTLLSIFFFHFYIDLLIPYSIIAHFPLSTFCSYTFLIPFHYRSVIIVPVTFTVYKEQGKLNFDNTWMWGLIADGSFCSFSCPALILLLVLGRDRHKWLRFISLEFSSQ